MHTKRLGLPNLPGYRNFLPFPVAGTTLDGRVSAMCWSIAGLILSVTAVANLWEIPEEASAFMGQTITYLLAGQWASTACMRAQADALSDPEVLYKLSSSDEATARLPPPADFDPCAELLRAGISPQVTVPVNPPDVSLSHWR